MCYGLDRQIYQILTIVERYDSHVFRQGVLLDILDRILQGGDYLAGVLPFSHDNDALYDIIFLHAAHLP